MEDVNFCHLWRISLDKRWRLTYLSILDEKVMLVNIKTEVFLKYYRKDLGYVDTIPDSFACMLLRY